MIIEAVGISLLLGLLRKGKFSNLQYIRFRGSWLFMLSFAIQAFAFARLTGGLFFWVHLLSYGVLLAGILMNVRIRPMSLMLCGTLMNAIVIAANSGRMPVKLPEDMAEVVFDRGHALMTSQTKLWLLGDIFIIDRPYPWPKVMSLGDFFLVAGVFWFIQYWLLLHKKIENSGENRRPS